MHLKAGAVQRIKTSQSGGHERQETDSALKKVVVLEMFFDLVASSLLNWAISVFEISDTQGAVGVLLATSVNLGGIGRAGLSGLWLRYPKHMGVHPGAEMRWREKGWNKSPPPFLLPARTKKHSRFGTEASQHVRRRRALPGALVSRLESQLVVGVMPCAFI